VAMGDVRRALGRQFMGVGRRARAPNRGDSGPSFAAAPGVGGELWAWTCRVGQVFVPASWCRRCRARGVDENVPDAGWPTADECVVPAGVGPWEMGAERRERGRSGGAGGVGRRERRAKRRSRTTGAAGRAAPWNKGSDGTRGVGRPGIRRACAGPVPTTPRRNPRPTPTEPRTVR
jgi:hypothetical protein